MPLKLIHSIALKFPQSLHESLVIVQPQAIVNRSFLSIELLPASGGPLFSQNEVLLPHGLVLVPTQGDVDAVVQVQTQVILDLRGGLQAKN